jgi:hypothetical protein
MLIDIINYITEKWGLIEELELDMSHKTEPEIDIITLIDPVAVKGSLISMEILWLTTENSPLRYMYDSLAEIVPEIQKTVLMTLNCVLNLCLVKNANGLVFRPGRLEMCNMARCARLRVRIKKRLSQLLPLYRTFERKCLNNIYKLTAKYYTNKLSS